MNNFKAVKYDFNRHRDLDNNHLDTVPLKIKEDPQKDSKPENITENISDNKEPLKKPPKQSDSIDHKPTVKAKTIITENLDNIDTRNIPVVSFVGNPYSRDIVLQENGKPATLRKFDFSYAGENFAGVTTDASGRIYLYDREEKFYRPLKHLKRTGDQFSAYHAGFREKIKSNKISSNYIDLGSLETLQAALQQSNGDKNRIKINNDSIDNAGFLINWMLATSPNLDHKTRYWNDNIIKMRNKREKNLFTYLLPLLIAAPALGAIIGLSVNAAFEDRINKDVERQLNATNNNQSFEVQYNDAGQVSAHYDDGSSLALTESQLSLADAQALDIDGDGKLTMDELTENESPLSASEINEINNHKEVNDILNRTRGGAKPLSEGGKIALATVASASAAGLGTYGFVRWNNRQKQKRINTADSNIIAPNDTQSDIAIAKPRKLNN
ncbi:MAG: hypothetical protein ACJARD_001749 [Alphaproteobacteria bacterium]|jgi:hypothetical protein